MTVTLTEFVLSNSVLKNGIFTATVQYGDYIKPFTEYIDPTIKKITGFLGLKV